ncbi:MAG: circularly permuted type 2 ATP-grasp protein, partial [Gammaproteobacteria bacterium]
MNFKNYNSNGFYDELLKDNLQARTGAGKLLKQLRKLNQEEINKRKLAAELAIKTMGISFTVYSEGKNIDRDWPYDIIPRIIPSREWTTIEQGLQQRLVALNHFINDIYNEQKIIKDKVIPKEILNSSKNFRKECIGMQPVFGVWAHICGSDLVRDKDGTLYVLEDNLRVPSGVSYMLENRKVTKRVFPELFEDYNIAPMGDYTTNLFDTLSSISPRPLDYPEVVVLTPGIYNSAYFEHSFLAQQMGAELVEGSDLVVGDDDCVYMKTIEGLSRVDVIYRRIDDMFLDPEVFNKDSMLGVPGLMRAWKKGNVALANAPGAGVADDKL